MPELGEVDLYGEQIHICEVIPDTFRYRREIEEKHSSTLDLKAPFSLVIYREAGEWVLCVHEEFVVPVSFCPFCGTKLEA